MTIIQSLITKLENNNNNMLIEKLEVLEKFISAEETNRLIEERKINNANQIDDIFSQKTYFVKNSDIIIDKEDKEDNEVIGEKDIMNKFKWVMIGIGVLILIIFILSIIYWFMSSSSIPPVIEPVVSNNEIQNVQVATPTKIAVEPLEKTEYSYFPNIFSDNKSEENERRSIETKDNERRSIETKDNERRLIESKENERRSIESKENERFIEQERLKNNVNERFIEREQMRNRENERLMEKDKQDKEKSFFSFSYFDKPVEEDKTYYDTSISKTREDKSKSYSSDEDKSDYGSQISKTREDKSKSYSSDEDKSDYGSQISKPREDKSKSYYDDEDDTDYESSISSSEEDITKLYPSDEEKSTSYSSDEEKSTNLDNFKSSLNEDTSSESESDYEKKSSNTSFSRRRKNDIYEIDSEKKRLEKTIRKPVGGKNK